MLIFNYYLSWLVLILLQTLIFLVFQYFRVLQVSLFSCRYICSISVVFFLCNQRFCFPFEIINPVDSHIICPVISIFFHTSSWSMMHIYVHRFSLSKYSSISCLYVLLISFFLMVYSLTYLGIISCLFYIIVTSHYYARLEGTRHTKEKRKQEIIFKVGLIKNIAKYILMQCIIIFIVTTLVSLVVGVPSVLQT